MSQLWRVQVSTRLSSPRSARLRFLSGKLQSIVGWHGDFVLALSGSISLVILNKTSPNITALSYGRRRPPKPEATYKNPPHRQAASVAHKATSVSLSCGTEVKLQPGNHYDSAHSERGTPHAISQRLIGKHWLQVTLVYSQPRAKLKVMAG